MLTQLHVGVICLALVLLVVPMAASNPAAAQADAEDPIVTFVKSHIKVADKPFTLLVGVKVKEGAGDKFEAAFAKAIAGTRKEKGCIRYDLNRSATDPSRYQVYERWKSIVDLEAHLKTEHIKTLRSEIGDLVVGDRELGVMTPAGE